MNMTIIKYGKLLKLLPWELINDGQLDDSEEDAKVQKILVNLGIGRDNWHPTVKQKVTRLRDVTGIDWQLLQLGKFFAPHAFYWCEECRLGFIVRIRSCSKDYESYNAKSTMGLFMGNRELFIQNRINNLKRTTLMFAYLNNTDRILMTDADSFDKSNYRIMKAEGEMSNGKVSVELTPGRTLHTKYWFNAANFKDRMSSFKKQLQPISGRQLFLE